jgi:hypothetical protein
MAAFTITTATNITSLIGKTGGDTYTVSGGTLTIDCDTRYAPNATTATGPYGGIAGSATLGGSIVIRGDNVKLISYSAGTGPVPASGTLLAFSGGGTAELLCVMSLKTGGTVTAAATTMPASAWLKVRNVTGTIASGNTFAGGTAGGTTSAAPATGWMEVVGTEALTITVSRLNLLSILGEWFSVGSTTGVRGQTLQLPAFAGNITEYPGVEIETSPGSGVYTFWPNAGQKATLTNLGTDTRSPYVWISTVGVCMFGRGPTATDCMQLPVAGCAVRVPNIVTSSCTAANRTINAVPNATIGTRYEIATNASGACIFSKVTGSWYFNMQQAYSLMISDLHTCDQSIISECTSPVQVNGWHVGASNNAVPYASNAIIVQQCYGGGSLTNVSGLRAESIATSGYAVTFTNLYGGFTLDNVKGWFAADPTAISGPIFFNTCDNFTATNLTVVGKRLLLSGCTNFSITGITYADAGKLTTPITLGSHAVEVTGNSRTGTITNIYNWPGVANVHPYNGVVYTATAFDITVRGVGTSTTPFNAGTVNTTGYLHVDGGNNGNVRFQRCWLTGLRTGLGLSTNSSLNTQVQNCYNVDATLTQGPNQINATWRGNRQNAGTVPTAYTHVDGTHFWDAFTGDTTARAAVVFSEKTTVTGAHYTVDAGTPKFTSAGTLVMTTVGDRITWTWPHAILGWSALSTFAVTGTNSATNQLIEYDLDKGAGFSGTFKTLSNVNLASETGISPTTGLKPRIRITCSIAATTNTLTSLVINGVTTLALQNAALYPLGVSDTSTLTLTGLATGSSVAVFASGTVTAGQTPVATGTSVASTMALVYPYDFAVPTYTVRIRKAGCDPVELTFTNATAVTIPVTQRANKDGFGVAVYGRGTGSTNIAITLDAAALRIDIGNTRTVAEDVYNVVAAWQATETGMRYPEALRFDGTDLLLMGSWRFRRALAAYTNAGVDALPVVDGLPLVSPDDEVNGSVDFRARSVRAYQLGSSPVMTEASIADAIWSKLLSNGATAEANLVSAKQNAANAFAVSA